MWTEYKASRQCVRRLVSRLGGWGLGPDDNPGDDFESCCLPTPVSYKQTNKTHNTKPDQIVVGGPLLGQARQRFVKTSVVFTTNSCPGRVPVVDSLEFHTTRRLTESRTTRKQCWGSLSGASSFKVQRKGEFVILSCDSKWKDNGKRVAVRLLQCLRGTAINCQDVFMEFLNLWPLEGGNQ